MMIDTGDTVKHDPTGETWVVAYVKGKYLSPCGWPECEALLSHCTLIEKASDEERLDLLRRLAEIPNLDARGRYARERLGIMEV